MWARAIWLCVVLENLTQQKRHHGEVLYQKWSDFDRNSADSRRKGKKVDKKCKNWVLELISSDIVVCIFVQLCANFYFKPGCLRSWTVVRCIRKSANYEIRSFFMPWKNLLLKMKMIDEEFILPFIFRYNFFHCLKNDQTCMIWIAFDYIFLLQMSELKNSHWPKSYDQKTTTRCRVGRVWGWSFFIVKFRCPCGQCESRKESTGSGKIKI